MKERKVEIGKWKRWSGEVFWASLLIFATSAGACRKPSANQESKPLDAKTEPAFPEEPPTVIFDVRLSSEGKSATEQLYECTYQSGGKTARFRLEWRQNGPLKGDIIPIAGAGGK